MADCLWSSSWLWMYFVTKHCSCTDDCSSSSCMCGQLSLRCWYDSVSANTHTHLMSPISKVLLFSTICRWRKTISVFSFCFNILADGICEGSLSRYIYSEPTMQKDHKNDLLSININIYIILGKKSICLIFPSAVISLLMQFRTWHKLVIFLQT